jgi:hypothetical protein
MTERVVPEFVERRRQGPQGEADREDLRRLRAIREKIERLRPPLPTNFLAVLRVLVKAGIKGLSP